MGLRIFTDVAIDDFSMSPECFGLNIPASELDGYNYYDPRITSPTVHPDFVDKSCKNIIVIELLIEKKKYYYKIFHYSNQIYYLDQIFA